MQGKRQLFLMQERLISLNMKVNLKVVHDTLNMFFKLLYLIAIMKKTGMSEMRLRKMTIIFWYQWFKLAEYTFTKFPHLKEFLYKTKLSFHFYKEKSLRNSPNHALRVWWPRESLWIFPNVLLVTNQNF